VSACLSAVCVLARRCRVRLLTRPQATQALRRRRRRRAMAAPGTNGLTGRASPDDVYVIGEADEMKQDCEAPRRGWAAAGDVRQTRAWRINRAVARDIVVQDYGWNSMSVQ
jgi:hypothetical protein